MVRNPNVAYTKDGSSGQALPQNLYYDMAKGPLASEFADQGDELSMVLRPIPAETPHLKGRVERKRLIF